MQSKTQKYSNSEGATGNHSSDDSNGRSCSQDSRSTDIPQSCALWCNEKAITGGKNSTPFGNSQQKFNFALGKNFTFCLWTNTLNQHENTTIIVLLQYHYMMLPQWSHSIMMLQGLGNWGQDKCEPNPRRKLFPVCNKHGAGVESFLSAALLTACTFCCLVILWKWTYAFSQIWLLLLIEDVKLCGFYTLYK